MSEPRTDHPKKAEGAGYEILSGLSALHQEPAPIPKPGRFISESDTNVQHAMDHFHAAFNLTEQSAVQIDSLCREAAYVLAVYHHRESISIENDPHWIIQQLVELRKQWTLTQKQDYCI